MLILYDLCCTGSWASLITAQFRSQNWRGKPVLPAISSPTFYTASTSPCLFHVILVLCKGTCGFKIPSISCHNLTVYTDNTVHFIFNNASQIWIPAYLESLHLLFTLPTCPAFCSKQKGKLDAAKLRSRLFKVRRVEPLNKQQMFTHVFHHKLWDTSHCGWRFSLSYLPGW